MYIFADTTSEAEALAADQSSRSLDVSEKACFKFWAGDDLAQSKVHFCSDMTLTGSIGGPLFTECKDPTQRLPAIDHSEVTTEKCARDFGARRYSANVTLTTQSFIQARSKIRAEKAFIKASSGAQFVSTDDKCWLYQAATDPRSFRLSHRTLIMSVGHPVEIVSQDDQEAIVVDGVIATIVAQAKNDPALTKQLHIHAAEMRSQKSWNHGWMSETMMIEALLRTWAVKHFRQVKG